MKRVAPPIEELEAALLGEAFDMGWDGDASVAIGC